MVDGFFLSAGCDYTGWDCQAWGQASVARDRISIEQFGISEQEMTRMMGLEYSRYTGEADCFGDKKDRFDLMDFD